MSCLEDVDYEASSSKLAHAYNHLNWYWNGRNRAEKTRVEFSSDEEFTEMSDFPTDLIVKMGEGSGKTKSQLQRRTKRRIGQDRS